MKETKILDFKLRKKLRDYISVVKLSDKLLSWDIENQNEEFGCSIFQKKSWTWLPWVLISLGMCSY